MNKLVYFKEGRSLIRRIINYRKNLMRLGVSNIPEGWAVQEMANVMYALEAISSYEKFARYIIRKKKDLLILIPTNKKAMRAEFEALTDTAEKIIEREFSY